MKVSTALQIEVTDQMNLALFLHASTMDDEYVDGGKKELPALDLAAALLRNPEESFATYARDDDLYDVGINQGDLLLVDKKLKPSHSDVVIISYDGELRCRVLDMKNSCLRISDDSQSPIELNEQVGLVVEGVVVQVIRQLR